MTIAISFDRQKLNTTNSFVDDVNFVTPAINGTVVQMPLVITALAVDSGSATILGTYTTGSDLVDAAAGTFTNDVIRIGDVVQTTPTGDFPASTTVLAVNSETQIQLSANPTAQNGDTNMTITPPATDATVGIVEVNITTGGSILNLTPKIYLFDGNVVQDLSGGGYDQATDAESTSNVTYAAANFNLDSFLSNARVARTN